jgi:predicted RNA-binding Zn-ribbon protein involved in translation (DUF1610 family)
MCRFPVPRGLSLKPSDRLTVRPCPLCGIAMQAAKTREDLEDFDRFECQNCGTLVIEAPQPPAPDGA